MRRSPFYAYPTFPHGFYAPPAQDAASFHRPHRPSPPPPAPNTRSVINIPVFDSAPSCPSSSSPQKHSNTSPPPSPAIPLIDSSTAATKIQSHFRGFNVRRHCPLFHLRCIAKARRQLEALQLELESPAFPLKVKASEKERLRFSESVMAIILSLDAIEGSVKEVRIQRKEATKMAIKLQDAMDAIILQRGENATLQPTDGSLSADVMTPEEDSVMCDQPNVEMVQGVCTTSEESIMDANPILEESTSLEESVADKFMSNDYNQGIVGDVVLPIKVVNDDQQQVEGGMSIPCSLEVVPKHAEVEHDSEPDMTPLTGDIVEVVHAAKQGLTLVTGENTGDSFVDVNPMQEESTIPEEDVADKRMLIGDNIQHMMDDFVPLLLPVKVEDVDQQVGADVSTTCCLDSNSASQLAGVLQDKVTDRADTEEGNDGIQTLHGIAPNIHAQNKALVTAMVDEDNIVDDLNAADHGYVQEAFSDQSYPCMDVVHKAVEGLRQDAKFRPGTPIAEEKCDYLHHSTIKHQNQLQGLEDYCPCDSNDVSTLHRGEVEGCSDVAYENAICVAYSSDGANEQSSSLAMAETSSSLDSALLLQLSENCKQLRSLVGKLLVQNKAQSKVICALGKRLELLEQQQQLNVHQRTRQKRKLGKGSKRSGKCCKWE